MQRHKVRGCVIWPFVLFSDEADDVPEWLFKHEITHAQQIERMGKLRFYVMYFYYQARLGYALNPLELEAREEQLKDLTPKEEHLLWKLREGSTS